MPVKKVPEHIDTPEALRRLPVEELPALARELRECIIDVVSAKQGHLGASLGVVELTIALHYVFDTPDDKLVWDVGHQAYGHKILTGRRAAFSQIRQLGGISGFPKRSESPYDAFGTGHSSTSISALLGMAIAASLEGNNQRQHIAVIGDASIAAGMAFEALNHAGETNANLLIILNDNAIGIDPSVGALKRYLTNVKLGRAKEENLFECLNLTYSGPLDGHDLPALIAALNRLKKISGPRLLHLITTKGKGLKQAEEQQVAYHAPGRFDRQTGDLMAEPDTGAPPKYQDVFGLSLVELARQNPKIIGITPAMPTGSSLKYMMEEIPERAFDVGIAEQHAVTLAAGMAAAGFIPFCNIYSTFLQRGYDQLIHDVALQQLPVVFCLDRAGIVGQDGPTHHGVFDMAFLRCIPNLIIFAPMNEMELRDMMYTAQLGLDKPLVIRYPRGKGNHRDWQRPFAKIEIAVSQELRRGSRIALLTVGAIGNMVADVIDSLGNPEEVGHYNMRFVKPLDKRQLSFILDHYEHIITVEDGCRAGGFGSAVLEYANEIDNNRTITIFGVQDEFLGHGQIEELYALAGMDANAIKNRIIEILNAQ
jgi:1-deoxy-D-xylulose-5-phosphate synthase